MQVLSRDEALSILLDDDADDQAGAPFGVGAGAISGAMLLRATFYLRALPYEAYEDPTPPQVSN